MSETDNIRIELRSAESLIPKMNSNETTNTTPELIIPLKFWFNQPNVKDIIESYPEIDEIRSKMDVIDNLTYDEVLSLKIKLSDLQDIINRKVGIMFTPFTPVPLNSDMEKVCNMINKLGHPLFEEDLKIEKTEEINGYKLYDAISPIMSFDEFDELNKKWKENKTYSFEEFFDLCDEEACTEWGKMDREGNSFAGKHYNAPKDSDDYMLAWNLTQKDNFMGLYELPYPKEAILKTIKMGCGNLNECVRFSNFICEWVKRKKEQLCL